MSKQNVIFTIFAGALFSFTAYLWYYNHPASPYFAKDFYLIWADEVGALVRGNDVSVNGVVSGAVHSVDLVGDKGVLVQIKLNRHIKVSKDAELVILSTGLTGDRVLSILQGNSSQNWNSKDTLFARFDAGSNRLVIGARIVFGQLDSVFSSISKSYDETFGSAQFKATLNQMQKGVKKIQSTTKELTASAQRDFVEIDGDLVAIQTHIDSLKSVTEDLRSGIGRNMTESKLLLKQVVLHIDEIKKNLDDIRRKLKSQPNSINEIYSNKEFEINAIKLYNSYIEMTTVISSEKLKLNVDMF